MKENPNRLVIKEVIVVEGRDDQANLQQYVDASYIWTNGFNFTKEIFERIDFASKQQGIIIFTDPDYAGNQIRKKVARGATGLVKHAYISQDEGLKDGDIGVENASEEALLKALKQAKAEVLADKQAAIYTDQDMYALGLVGTADSKARRVALGKYLNIGYGNAKQFLSRLNAYQVAPEKIQEFFEGKSDRQGDSNE